MTLGGVGSAVPMIPEVVNENDENFFNIDDQKNAFAIRSGTEYSM